MELTKQFIVSATVTIAQIDPAPDGRSTKPMSTDIVLALPDTSPETVMEALKHYVDDKWSPRPHQITKVHKITSQQSEIWTSC